MTNYFENRLSMLKTVQTVCDEYETEISGIPALASAYMQYKAKLAEIDTAVQNQITDIHGVTQDKKALRNSLAIAAEVIASALTSFASVTGNNELKTSVKFSSAKLLNMRDDIMIETCSLINIKAGENIAALADYGIDASTYAAFQLLLANTMAKNAATTAVRGHHKYYTKQSRELITEAIKLLKARIDTNLKVLRAAHPEFYEVYINSRAVIDLHGKPRTHILTEESALMGNIMGTITDAQSGEPIENAKIELVEKALSIETDQDGEFYLEEVPEGIHTIRVTKDGYETYTENNFTVAKDDELSKDIVISALPAIQEAS
jgi:hypothetical protein